LKGQSSDPGSEVAGQQPPTETEERYTSRSEGENQDRFLNNYLEGIQLDQDEPKTERNQHVDRIDSDVTEDNLFGDKNNTLGQKIKISDIINKKRQAKKSLSGDQNQHVKPATTTEEKDDENDHIQGEQMCKEILG